MKEGREMFKEFLKVSRQLKKNYNKFSMFQSFALINDQKIANRYCYFLDLKSVDYSIEKKKGFYVLKTY